MQINITFVIQIINFIITYFFLGKMIFKPISETIHDREKIKEDLQNNVKEQENILKKFIDKKETRFKELQKNVYQYYDTKKIADLDENDNLKYFHDEYTIKSTIKEGKEIIVKKVLDAYS
jgi:hypothetical protein